MKFSLFQENHGSLTVIKAKDLFFVLSTYKTRSVAFDLKIS